MASSVVSSPSFLTRYPYLANSLLACGIMGIGDLTAQTIERRSASRTPPRRGCSGTSQSDSRSNRVVGNNVSTHDYDLTRTAVLCSYSFSFFSPYCLFVYSRIGALKLGGKTVVGEAFRRAALSNLSMAAPMNMVFFAYVTTVEAVVEIGGLRAVVRTTAPTPSNGASRNAPFDGVGPTSDGRGSIDGGRREENGGRELAMQSEDGVVRGPFLSGISGPAARADIGRRVVEKWRYDLPETLVKSACLWIPVTTLNFWLVPARFRVVMTSFVAVVWNTFLSLVQHRGRGE